MYELSSPLEEAPSTEPVEIVIPSCMVPSSSSHEMCIVCRRNNGDASCAACIEMTQLVGQVLQIVWGEVVIIQEDIVMGRARSPQGSCMRLEIEIEFERMNNDRVDDRPWLTVAKIIFASAEWEEPGVVTLLDNDKGDRGSVVAVE